MVVLIIEKLRKDNDKIKKTMLYRRVIYVVLAISYFFVYFHRTSPAVMASALTNEFNVDSAGLGLLSSMYFYAYALGQLPAGILADRWGPRKTVSVFLCIAGVGSIAFGMSSSFAGLIGGRFLVGLGVGFVYVPAMRILADWFKKNEFATFSGILLAVGNIGSLAASAPLVLLMMNIGWRSSMYIVGGISVLLAILSYIIIRNKPYEIGGATIEEIEGHSGFVDNLKKDSKLREELTEIFRNKNFLSIAAISFVFYGSTMGFQGLWAGPFLQDVYGFTKAEAGNILMMIPLGMIVGCPLAGYISDRIFKSRKKVLLFGAILQVVAWVPLIFMTSRMSRMFITVIMFYYGLVGGSFVLCFANTKETCGNHVAGTSIGAVNVFLFGGGAIFQQVMGTIIGRYPQVSIGINSVEAYRSAFIMCAISLIVVIIIYSFHKENTL